MLNWDKELTVHEGLYYGWLVKGSSKKFLKLKRRRMGIITGFLMIIPYDWWHNLFAKDTIASGEDLPQYYFSANILH